jgi:hypothetical protein
VGDDLICCYRGYVLKIMSNSGLLVFVNVTFICRFCKVRLYTWNRSNVFNRSPFFWMWRISIVSSIVSYRIVCVGFVKYVICGSYVNRF